MADVVRLSRGQSHDFMTWFENRGLTPNLADKVMTYGRDFLCNAAAAMLFAGFPRGYWEETVASALHSVAHSIDSPWFSITVPKMTVTTGQVVDRLLNGWTPCFMPTREEISSNSIIHAWASRVPDFRPNAYTRIEARPTQYWYWFRIEPVYDSLLSMEDLVANHPLASVEEALMAMLINNRTGFPKYPKDEVEGSVSLVRTEHGDTRLYVSVRKSDDTIVPMKIGFCSQLESRPKYICLSERM